MDDAISIIIPMYNVESYVEQCLRSVAAQRHENIEVIVVDDGITDRSGVIADEFAAQVIGDIKFPAKRNLMEDGVFTSKVLVNAARVFRIVELPTSKKCSD